MTVAATTNRKTYTGDNVTTSFATSPVIFYATSDLQVRVTVIATGVSTLLTLNTHYTVSGGSSAGAVGTVSLAGGSSPHGALLSTEKLVILRVLPLTQGVDFVNNNNSDAEVLEAALDKLTDVDQQLSERQDRALTFPEGDVSASTTTLQDASVRAGRLLGFDAVGVLTTVIMTAGTSLVDFASSIGSSLIGFLQAGAGAVVRSLQSKNRDVVSAFDFMTAAQIADIQANTCTLDVTTALQNFFNVGGLLYLNKGTYKHTAKLTVPGGTTVYGAGPLQSSIKKFFNGDQFDWGDLSTFKDMSWDGNGGSFTGSNATISSGTAQRMYNCFFFNAASNPIKWTVANTGTVFSFVSSQIYSTTITNAACLFNSGDTSTFTKGELLNIDCNGGYLFDTSTGAVGGLKAIGCTTQGLVFNDNNVNVAVIGCRLATNDIHVKGTNVQVNGCAVAGDLYLDAGATGCSIGPNMLAAGKKTIDNSGLITNRLYNEPVSYAPTWTASSVNPVIGNGTITGSVVRNGPTVHQEFKITMGNTTTFGTGLYAFSAPYQNNSTTDWVGVATMYDSSAATFYVGTALVLAGSSTLQIVYTTATIQPVHPFTWAQSDSITVNITGSTA